MAKRSPARHPASCRVAGDHLTALPALSLHRRDAPAEPVRCIYDFGLAVTTQGAKQVILADKLFHYGPAESMLTPIDLPIVAHISHATRSAPKAWLGAGAAVLVLLPIWKRSTSRFCSMVRSCCPGRRRRQHRRYESPLSHAISVPHRGIGRQTPAAPHGVMIRFSGGLATPPTVTTTG